MWRLFLLEIYKTQMTHHKFIIRHLNKSQTGYPNQISQITYEIYDQRMSPFTITLQRFKITLLVVVVHFLNLCIAFHTICRSLFFFLLSLPGYFCLQDCKCILLFNSLIQFNLLSQQKKENHNPEWTHHQNNKMPKHNYEKNAYNITYT